VRQLSTIAMSCEGAAGAIHIAVPGRRATRPPQVGGPTSSSSQHWIGLGLTGARWVGFLRPRWPDRGDGSGRLRTLRGVVLELAVEAFVVEPVAPAAGGDLYVVEAFAVPAVGGQGGGVAWLSPLSRRISCIIRTVRPRSSSGYFCDPRRAPPVVAMLHPRFRGQEHPRVPARFMSTTTTTSMTTIPSIGGSIVLGSLNENHPITGGASTTRPSRGWARSTVP
jgi:hypothetical protein